MDEQTQKFLTTIAENVPKVKQQGYAEGKKAEYDAFWDACQYNGTRKDYKYAFAYNSWNYNNFYPKYDIKPIGDGASYMFAGGGSNSAYDLAKRLEEQGVVLDLSGLTSSDHEFYLSRFTKLPTLDFSGCTSMVNTFDYFVGGTKLSLIFSDNGETTFNSVFRRCSRLTDIIIERGIIGKNFNVAHSPLSVESMKSIIEHLKDYTGLTDDSGNSLEKKYTLTLTSDCVAALEAEGFTAEHNGYPCTWLQLIDSKQWNLVSSTA